MEFLVHITIDVPADLGAGELEKLKRDEAGRAAELAAAGTLLRLWRDDTSGWTNWGLWLAPDSARLNDAIRELPLYPYMRVVVHPLAPHPSDPAPRDTHG